MIQANQNSSRAAALARRKAMSVKGKSAAASSDRTRDESMVPRGRQAAATVDRPRPTQPQDSGYAGLADERDDAAIEASHPDAPAKAPTTHNGKPGIGVSPGRAAALARRKAQSTHGKAGGSGNAAAQAQTSRADSSGLSGRELARAMRQQRSTRGKTGDEKTRPCGRQRAGSQPGAAQDATWKVGASETSHGQTVTGSMVGQAASVTGSEASTCREITGTEYLGADDFREFCHADPAPAPRRTGLVSTGRGNAVTGNMLGRSARVTGDEPGSCKKITGTEYVARGEGETCNTAAARGVTRKGMSITGDNAGSFSRVTGVEAGAERTLTGAQYIKSGTPGRVPRVGVSATFSGLSVSGTMNGRTRAVTGNEPGTCKAITGTPYFGAESYADYCDASDSLQAAARMRRAARTAGMNLTGQQPGIGGVMTGAGRGACEPVTGTPYVGADQVAEACPAVSTGSGNADDPQGADEVQAWGGFSVTPPSHAASARDKGVMSGCRCEQGQITGSFGMARGKVTGTEEALYGGTGDSPTPAHDAAEPQSVEGRVKSRITGEGQDSGLRITGDDWDRGDHVTGTEGTSALTRNPSRRGPANAMTNKSIRDAESKPPVPNSKVTGSSGNYEGGSLITYSGGARG